MNQNIQQAWDAAAKTTALLPTGPNSWQTQVNFMQCFAELVINQCVDTCYNTEAEYGEPVSAAWCASAIRQYWGLEP